MSAAGPISSEIRGRVIQCGAASIHGDIYYDMVIEHFASPETTQQVRAPSHVCPREPRVGDDVVVTLLLMQAQRVEFV